MISSQDGTEERRPRAFLRPGRPGCSPVASAFAPRAGADAAPVSADAAEGAAAAGVAGVAGAVSARVPRTPFAAAWPPPATPASARPAPDAAAGSPVPG